MFELLPSPDPAREAQWSLELLSHLEWHRFQELVARLLHRVGYQVELAWVRPDGGTGFTLVQPMRPGQLEAVVQCAPWAAADIEPGALQQLQEAAAREGAVRGIFVTPGLYTPAARAFAQGKPLELVDGSDLLRTFYQMGEEERSYFLRLTTVGPYMIPTCPSCMRKMEMIDDCAAAKGQQTRDVVYKNRRFESSDVDCRSLILKKNADVVFMKSVTTRAMTVYGRATGNIVVNGQLHVARGGCVSGLVSARAIKLDPGGSLEAEARILNEAGLPHLRHMPVNQIWRCPGYPKCRATLPLR